MATAEPATHPHDRSKGRRPFSTWMKRLANLKHSGSSPQGEKKSPRTKRNWSGKNNPYRESGYVSNPPAPSTFSGGASSFTPASVGSERVGSFTSYEDSTGSPNAPMRSNKSNAPTLATNAETIHSDTGFSRAGTTHTDGIYSGRANSTFSSPQQSQESLATTLTTIQSTAPSTMVPANAVPTLQSPVNFTHQYPISPPASAVPTHLYPQPQTYNAATANGILSDDASIMTLASSSKRRRRNSLDTNASVRALAPSSLWGNSRESLPLSVLSSNIDRDPMGSTTTFAPSQAAGRPSMSGLASAERASLYSNPGIGAPALMSERNSYYSTKQAIDSVSVRSGLLGHGRTDSINGSITGLAGATTSPLASPREAEIPGRSSRRTSEWKEGDVEEEEDIDETVSRCDHGKGKENGKEGDSHEEKRVETPDKEREVEVLH